MLRLCACVCVALAACAGERSRPAQQIQEPSAAEQPAEQYFSGAVVSYSGDKLTVARTVLGTKSSSRRFVITPETRIDGRLRVRVRVTVQFVTKGDIDRAVHIIVRDPAPKK